MLSNAYFLANFRFDTAENEPAKNLQKFARVVPVAPVATVVPVDICCVGRGEGWVGGHPERFTSCRRTEHRQLQF